MKRYLFTALALLSALSHYAVSPADSLRSIQLAEVAVVASPKENTVVRQRPASISVLSRKELQTHSIESLKELGSLIPNFFISDYGSHQTSAIYIRGIGSRSGTPTVGLIVDGIPYYDKSAFDFSLAHVEQIEVARGAQNTLYGRGTMGGVVNVSTRSPLNYQGTDVHLGYATGNHQRRLSLTHYHHPMRQFAFSVGIFYEGDEGFFRHSLTRRKVDGGNMGGMRLRGIYRPTDSLTFDASLHYEYLDEDTYPYYYTGVTSGEETFSEGIGRITSNLENHYRRQLMNAGVRTDYRLPHVTLHATTSYQHITDHMAMDQDFLWQDIYALQQHQRIHVLSQELMAKIRPKKHFQGLVGANVFYQWQTVQAPVTFRQGGVQMLNNIINTQANKYLPTIHSGPMSMQFRFDDRIQGNALTFDDDFRTPTLGVALYYQMELKDIFNVRGLNATLGQRLDYERVWLNYDAWYDFSHTYSLNGHLTMPTMERDIAMVPEQTFRVVNNTVRGRVSDDHLQLQPKFTLQYRFAQGNVYGSVSRGHRSGGYNVQNISEILRDQMQGDMMSQVRDVTLPVLNAQPMVPQQTKEQVAAILNAMATHRPVNISETCEYLPEYAWNYEIGTHLNFLDGRLQTDLSAFVSNVYNLQLLQMSATGLGRVIVNAGRSRSAGLEVAFRARPVKPLSLSAQYGYTHATFRSYCTTDEAGRQVNYRGNYVPYVPQHTLNVEAAYDIPLRHRFWQSLTVGSNLSAAGRIYWNEVNTRSQDLYAQLGARVSLSSRQLDLQLWGKNLTDTRYNSFWFESAGRGYEQHGRPLQVGVDVQWRF